MLDNRITFETPESIELHLVPAGPVPRVLAFTIDWVIRMVILIILSFAFSPMGEFGSGLYLILYFVLEWFYSVFFEVVNHGATPGKKAMKIKVVHDDGTPLNFGASVLRNIMRAADFFPFGYLAGLISMTCSQGFKRLGDHVAATLVVYAQTTEKAAKLTEVGSRPAPFLLELDEQQAIMDFAERSNRLSTARQQELADILAPVLPKQAGNERVSEIKKIANGIIGQS